MDPPPLQVPRSTGVLQIKRTFTQALLLEKSKLQIPQQKPGAKLSEGGRVLLKLSLLGAFDLKQKSFQNKKRKSHLLADSFSSLCSSPALRCPDQLRQPRPRCSPSPELELREIRKVRKRERLSFHDISSLVCQSCSPLTSLHFLSVTILHTGSSCSTSCSLKRVSQVVS